MALVLQTSVKTPEFEQKVVNYAGAYMRGNIIGMEVTHAALVDHIQAYAAQEAVYAHTRGRQEAIAEYGAVIDSMRKEERSHTEKWRLRAIAVEEAFELAKAASKFDDLPAAKRDGRNNAFGINENI